MIHPEFQFVIARTDGRQRVMTLEAALEWFRTPAGQWDSHLSISRYDAGLRDYAQAHDGSAKGYDGHAYADYLPFDLDGETPAESLSAARALAHYLHDCRDVPPDSIKYSYSGGGGYHLELPMRLFGDVQPSPHMHLILRHLAGTLACEAGVTDLLDMQRYARLALLRVAGSQQPNRPPGGKWYAQKTVLDGSDLSIHDENAHERASRAQ